MNILVNFSNPVINLLLFVMCVKILNEKQIEMAGVICKF